MEGWLKLHRKILHSTLFDHPNDFQVFILLLLLADRDGKLTITRNQIAERLQIDPYAAYRSLRRLDSAQQIAQQMHNKFTNISICKWHIYQNVINENAQQNAHLNKNIYKKQEDITNITNVMVAKPRNTELDDLINFAKSLNFPFQGSQRGNRFGAANLLKKMGLEKSKRLVQAAIASQGMEYAPEVADFNQLYRKMGNLVSFWQKQKKGGHLVL